MLFYFVVGEDFVCQQCDYVEYWNGWDVCQQCFYLQFWGVVCQWLYQQYYVDVDYYGYVDVVLVLVVGEMCY